MSKRMGSVGRTNLVLGVIVVVALVGGLLWVRSGGDDAGSAAGEPGQTGDVGQTALATPEPGTDTRGVPGGPASVPGGPADASTSGASPAGAPNDLPPDQPTTTTTAPTTTTLPDPLRFEFSETNLEFGRVQVDDELVKYVKATNLSESKALRLELINSRGEFYEFYIAGGDGCARVAVRPGGYCVLGFVFRPTRAPVSAYGLYEFASRSEDGVTLVEQIRVHGTGVEPPTRPSITTPPATVPSAG